MSENLFVAARKGSGLSLEEAGEICGLSISTYSLREKNPGDFKLKELQSLWRQYGSGAKAILQEATSSFFES